MIPKFKCSSQNIKKNKTNNGSSESNILNVDNWSWTFDKLVKKKK